MLDRAAARDATFADAEAVSERVARDRNRITGAGVTAGIDFWYVLAQELFGAETAQAIQLAVEYEPASPFSSGSPIRRPSGCGPA